MALKLRNIVVQLLGKDNILFGFCQFIVIVDKLKLKQDFAKGMVLAARILVDSQLVGIETKIRLKGTAR